MSEYNPFDKFQDMRPINRVPTLSTLNGIGATLVGRRDFDEETGTYVTTQSICVLFIPLIALGAYRVADGPDNSYYFIGRVPLSRFARRWNVLLCCLLLLGGGIFGWNHYTGTDDYKAGRQLAEAERLAGEGQQGKAAQLYREVMKGPTSHAPAAKTKLKELIESPPASLQEAAGVFTVALELHRQNQDLVPNLFDRAAEQAQKKEETDPNGALALLEVVAPLAPKPADVLAIRRRLLERLVSAEPDNPALASRLAVVCEALGDQKHCEAILKPHESRLKDLEGAVILGRIRASQGKYDQADKLLDEYLAIRLPLLRSAEQKYLTVMRGVESRTIELLNTGKAPGFSYDRYKMASDADKATLVNDYCNAKFKENAEVMQAQQALAGQAAVVPAALELGMVRLYRAQGLADPEARRKELERAEQTFLSVREQAGQNDTYRLNLSQVYYWLGKHAEGEKLINDLLVNHNRSYEVLLAVARMMREVGVTSKARSMVEEAYTGATDITKKQEAAMMRSVMATDLDDQIAWLGKANPNALEVKALLASSRGAKAVRNGKDEEATKHFRESIATYAKMPENVSTLNNCALVHFELFEVTQERDEFVRGLDKLDRAIALRPDDSLLVSNGASFVLSAALRDVVGSAIDLKVLKRAGGIDLLSYLYLDQAGKNQWLAKMRDHPGYLKREAITRN